MRNRMSTRYQSQDKPKRRNKAREAMHARFVEAFGEKHTSHPSMQVMLDMAVRFARNGDPVVVMMYGGCPFVGRRWPTELE